MTARGLRIIAGTLRGRRLRVPSSAAVRPTPERVREALFSILGGRIPGARVLDAFAGSGALGFEALSRGALRVAFVESDRRVADVLRDNAAGLELSASCDVVEGRVPGVLDREGLGGPFDVVLADPPYATHGVDRETALEALGRVLDGEGLLVWERESRTPAIQAAGLELEDSRRYGNTTLDLYVRAVADPQS